MTKKILVVGAGLSGATIAREMAEKGYQVDVIEKRDHIAGNCYDYINNIGILMNKYGPHLFHTKHERVWAYVNRFSEWVPYKHRVLGCIDGIYFPIPVNINTVNILCNQEIKNEEEMKTWLSANTIKCDLPTNSKDVGLSRVGHHLYEKIFKGYTFKQWDKFPEELAPSVLERIPVRENYDPYYFSDKYQALPKQGYTAMVANMLDHPNISVKLGVPYDKKVNALYWRVFYTGPIDAYFAESGYDKLEYRSLRFEEETLNIEKFNPIGQVNYPSLDQPYTRIIEYKHFLDQYIPGKTTIVKEYSTAVGEPYYPVPTPRNQELYKLYQQLAQGEENVCFVGRLATYKYYNMDEAILAALEIVDSFNT